MTSRNSEIASFLTTIPKLLAPFVGEGGAEGPEVDAALRQALAGSGVLDLGLETADLPDAREWLAATVERVAHSSPSLAFTLASRYAAQRALAAADDGDSTVGVVVPEGGAVVVPTQLAPSRVVLVDLADRSARLATVDAWADDAAGVRRTGLRDSGLRTALPSDQGEALAADAAAGVAHDWCLLVAAAALGTAGASLSAAQTYALGRRQFGDVIASFAGLRAILVEMDLRVAEVRALVERAQAADADLTDAVAALAAAGPAAVDTSIDAIQVHGGYGYIDEYPVARLLRDATSLRARGGGRRALVALLAEARLGPVGQAVRA